MENLTPLERYRKGARKIKDFTEGKMHHVCCNYQPTRPGQYFCNCGITDILYALKEDEWENAKKDSNNGPV